MRMLYLEQHRRRRRDQYLSENPAVACIPTTILRHRARIDLQYENENQVEPARSKTVHLRRIGSPREKHRQSIDTPFLIIHHIHSFIQFLSNLLIQNGTPIQPSFIIFLNAAFLFLCLFSP